MKLDEKKFRRELLKRIEGYSAGVRLIYNDSMEKLISLVMEIEHDYNPDKPFKFSDYPVISERANNTLRELYSRLYSHIKTGVIVEWEMANLKNDSLVTSVFGKSAIDNKHYARYFQRNKKALDSFFQRKSQYGGLNLSQRIWKYEGQFREEMEIAFSNYMGQGMSANSMATKIKEFLQEPNHLYRRVRNSNNNLVLSKNARAYHPGQGYYRSSYRNAQRLARTETNIAYHTADHERWMQLDFVVGIEIKLSNNHPQRDICDDLAGRYPKDFKFTGWHPNCMCHQEAILATDEEIDEMTDKILADELAEDFHSVNEVESMPDNYNMWIEENEERIKKAKENGTLAYWLRDNINIQKL